MKKSIFAVLVFVLLLSVSPSVASASWWNPMSWFRKSAPVSTVAKDDSQNSGNVEVKQLTDKDTTITLKIGDVVKVLGVNATVVGVEDSRCAKGVQCIQAGTVKVKISASFGIFSKNITLSQNDPFVFHGHVVILSSVTPEKLAGVTLAPSDYTFTFSLGTTSSDDTNTNPNSMAKCLKNKGVTFYGAFWCPHCQAQKALFGSSAKDLPYVECSTPDGKGQTDICLQKGIRGYPTWRFADGSEISGEVPLKDLSQRSGCAIDSK